MNTPLGLALLSKETSKTVIEAKSDVINLSGKTIFQYLEVHLKAFGIKGIMFYVNKKPNKTDIKSLLKHFKHKQLEFFIGDLNLDATDINDRKRISLLTDGLKMKAILHQLTHRSHIDHVMTPSKSKLVFYSTAFSNLYTDHAAVTLRICFDGNFTSEFVQNQITKQDLNYLIHQDPVKFEGKNKSENIEREQRHEQEEIPEEDIIMKGRNFILKESDLERLIPPRYLSDDIINAYCHLISEKYKDVF